MRVNCSFFLLTVPLLQFLFVRVSMVTCVAFGLSLLVPHLFFFRSLGKAVRRVYDIYWVSSLIL